MARRSITNNRRSYLCTYDVASDKAGDKRRSKLFDLLMDHGEHVQFSVFLCVLTRTEITRLNAAAEEILHRDQDQLLIMDLGPDGIDWTSGLICIGKIWTPQVRSRII
jgi:CRISPR-associated protein Cas2